jgi:GTPase SAR1 family protein
MGSPIDPLMHRNSSADIGHHKGSKSDLSKTSSPDLSSGRKNGILALGSQSSLASLKNLDSPSSKDVTFSLEESPTTNGETKYDCMKTSYEIATDINDISRYKFSEGTLKLIEHTFGRKRHESNNKDERLGFISMWDFAGQYIFYATHQVFLSPRAVYILVLDLSKGLDHFVQDEEFPIECNDLQGQLVKDYGEFWLRSIHTFCGDVPGQPPIILVGTHRNELDCAPYEQDEQVEKYFEDFRKLVENSPVSNHIQPEQFAIDNTLSDEEFDKLKKSIVDVAKRQKHWNQEIPARWLPLERFVYNSDFNFNIEIVTRFSCLK